MFSFYKLQHHPQYPPFCLHDTVVIFWPRGTKPVALKWVLLRALARKLASPFGHSTQVSTQIQLVSPFGRGLGARDNWHFRLWIRKLKISIIVIINNYQIKSSWSNYNFKRSSSCVFNFLQTITSVSDGVHLCFSFCEVGGKWGGGEGSCGATKRSREKF